MLWEFLKHISFSRMILLITHRRVMAVAQLLDSADCAVIRSACSAMWRRDDCLSESDGENTAVVSFSSRHGVFVFPLFSIENYPPLNPQHRKREIKTNNKRPKGLLTPQG
jgi:hypothetical protein